MQRLITPAIFALTACAAPAAMEAESDIEAWGFSRSSDIAMARNTASNRARAALLKQAGVGAVVFRFEAALGASTLTTSAEGSLSLVNTAYPRIKGTTASRASAKRSAEVTAQIKALPLVQTEAEVRHEDPATAYVHAEMQAIRQAIVAARKAQKKPIEGALSGRLTIAAMRVEFLDSGGIRLRLASHVEVEREEALQDAGKRAVLLGRANEHQDLGEVSEATALVERGMSAYPQDLELLLYAARLQLAAKHARKAAEIFARAAALAPEDLEVLAGQREAYAAIPDASAVAAVDKRIAEVEAKKKASAADTRTTN